MKVYPKQYKINMDKMEEDANIIQLIEDYKKRKGFELEEVEDNGDSFTSDELNEEFELYTKSRGLTNYDSGIYSDLYDVARHFAQWGAEHLKK